MPKEDTQQMYASKFQDIGQTWVPRLTWWLTKCMPREVQIDGTYTKHPQQI